MPRARTVVPVAAQAEKPPSPAPASNSSRASSCCSARCAPRPSPPHTARSPLRGADWLASITCPAASSSNRPRLNSRYHALQSYSPTPKRQQPLRHGSPPKRKQFPKHQAHQTPKRSLLPIRRRMRIQQHDQRLHQSGHFRRFCCILIHWEASLCIVSVCLPLTLHEWLPVFNPFP